MLSVAPAGFCSDSLAGLAPVTPAIEKLDKKKRVSRVLSMASAGFCSDSFSQAWGSKIRKKRVSRVLSVASAGFLAGADPVTPALGNQSHASCRMKVR